MSLRAPSVWRVAPLIAVLMTAGPAVLDARAQAVSSSTIHGSVVDGTGAALPGVTVTASSPALQGDRVSVSEGDGNYRLTELPAGTYRLRFELAGFSPFIRDDLRITIGFTARVDAKLGVGSIEETVTVSGQSPVVDLSATGTSATFTAEVLSSVPRGRDLQTIVEMAPGVTRDGAPDVGGSTMAARPAMSTYGVEATPKIQVEGINITTGSDANTAVYFNYFGMEDVMTKTSGTSAEVGTPGLHLVAVLKSGGNEFHGNYEASYQGSGTQSNNLSETLRAQGLRNTEPLKFHYDAAADLGGRIIRDTLWFYGGVSRQHRNSGLLGFVSGPGPDGVYLTGDESLADYNNLLTNYNAKVSWQVSQGNRLIGAVQYGLKTQPQNEAGRFRPLEATRDYLDPTWVRKLELQSTLSPRMQLNIVGGYGGYFADYSAMRTSAYQGPEFPSRFDRETGLRTGGHEASDQRPRDNWQLDGSFSYFPERSFAGRHELKTGGTWYRYLHGTGKLEHPHGNYELTYDRVGGVSHQPVEIEMHNYPTSPRNRVDVQAWYAMDTWRATNRITANLGLRVERQHAFVPPQSKAASSQFPQLFPAGTFQKVEVITWLRALPRLGLAFELNPQTVVKTSYGVYNDMYRDADVGNFNVNADQDIVFRWRDQNGDGTYTPGEVNLDINGPDFLSITGASNRVLNPDLRQPLTTEVTASLERGLIENTAVRVGYVYRSRRDLYDFAGVNVLRPREVYNIGLTRRDPGPDGNTGTADDGGLVTIYDYDPAYRGATFVNQMQVNTDKIDRFHTIEGAFTRRLSGGWMAQLSGWALKNRRWIERHFDTPNDDPYPLDETWDFGVNLSGIYMLPAQFQVSGFVQGKSGVKGARTNVFRQADPDGGPRLAQLSTVTLRMEPYGERRGPAIVNTNLRLSKNFSVAGGRTVGFDLDAFNIFNSGVPTAITYASGPIFGYATGVMPARIIRIGGRFRF